MKIWIQGVAATVGGFLGWFLGGLDGLVYALIAFIVIDYLTGFMRGILKKKLNSKVGAEGIFKKIVMLLLVGVANIIDIYLVQSGNSPLRTAVIFFYVANEGLSILENACAIGLPVPQKLKDVVAQFQKRDENGGDSK